MRGLSGLVKQDRGTRPDPANLIVAATANAPLRLERPAAQRCVNGCSGCFEILRHEHRFPIAVCAAKLPRLHAIQVFEFRRPDIDVFLNIPLEGAGAPGHQRHRKPTLVAVKFHFSQLTSGDIAVNFQNLVGPFLFVAMKRPAALYDDHAGHPEPGE